MEGTRAKRKRITGLFSHPKSVGVSFCPKRIMCNLENKERVGVSLSSRRVGGVLTSQRRRFALSFAPIRIHTTLRIRNRIGAILESEADYLPQETIAVTPQSIRFLSVRPTIQRVFVETTTDWIVTEINQE